MGNVTVGIIMRNVTVGIIMARTTAIAMRSVSMCIGMPSITPTIINVAVIVCVVVRNRQIVMKAIGVVIVVRVGVLV